MNATTDQIGIEHEVSVESDVLQVVGIAGSLRKHSVNRALLAAAAELAPSNVRVDLLDIADIPLYNQDIDNDASRPASVELLKQQIAQADGVLLASPEYNFGVSGVLKNTIDWVSRPAMRSPLAYKPIGIMGASPSALGTARAQEDLKSILMATLAALFPHPGVVVGHAMNKFEDGVLTDEKTIAFVEDYMRQFAAWVRRVSAIAAAA